MGAAFEEMFESPEVNTDPELVVDTASLDVSQSATMVLDYVARNLALSVPNDEA